MCQLVWNACIYAKQKIKLAWPKQKKSFFFSDGVLNYNCPNAIHWFLATTRGKVIPSYLNSFFLVVISAYCLQTCS